MMNLEDDFKANLGLDSGATTVVITEEQKQMANNFLDTISNTIDPRELPDRLLDFYESQELTRLDKLAIGLSVFTALANAVKYPALSSHLSVLGLGSRLSVIAEGIENGNLIISDFTDLVAQ